MKDYLKETPATESLIFELREACKGLGGDSDAETVLGWTKWESVDGYVEFYSCRGADVAAVLKRCGSQVISFTKRGGAVSLRIRVKDENGKRVFRGFEFAFAPVDVESKPLPDGVFS